METQASLEHYGPWAVVGAVAKLIQEPVILVDQAVAQADTPANLEDLEFLDKAMREAHVLALAMAVAVEPAVPEVTATMGMADMVDFSHNLHQ
jgi:hypothetical protein